MRIILCLLAILLSSCSLVQRQGIRITSGIIADGSYEVETDGNLDFIAQALPANLKLVESMLYLDPENKKLLATLLKGYVGYAFAINETAYLQEQLQDIEQGKAWKQAVLNYSRGLEYGLRYLSLSGAPYAKLSAAINSSLQLSELLDGSLDGDDLQDFEVVFYTAQALGSLINLQKGNLKLVAQLPLVKAMFDWSCSKRPKFNFGACQIFYASYDASRPKMLGGNPAKGKKLFQQAIKQWPENDLIKVAYLQYYAIPLLDEGSYAEVIALMQGRLTKNNSWTPGQHKQRSHLELFNSIAQRRLKIIQQFKEDIF